MSPVLDYLIKLSVSLAFTSLFYQLFLRRLTFYNWNRLYLLKFSALSFLVPFIDINHTIETISHADSTAMFSAVPTISQIHPQVTVSQASTPQAQFGMESWILAVLAIGSGIMLLRMLFHWYSFRRIVRKAELVSEDDIKIYHVKRNISPFSFGRSIFYNPEMHGEDELKDIILHEYIHVRQRHTLDVIWAEILCVLNWYNPFAWMIRHAIRQNLEYIADDQVLQNEVDPRDYQYLLLKVAGVPEFRIANRFNFSSLKERIIMMNKKRTPRFFLVSFLFAMPLLVVLLLFFRNDIAKEKEQDPFLMFWENGGPQIYQKNIYIAGLLLEQKTGKPLANVPLNISFEDEIVKTIRTDADGYYYESLPVRKPTGKIDHKKHIYPSYNYSLSYDGDDYNPFIRTETPVFDSLFFGGFGVTFQKPNAKDALGKTDMYGVDKREFFINYEGSDNDEKAAVKEYLLTHLPPLLAEHKLKMDFLAQVRFPKNVINKFKNGYFDRKKELMGYEGETKLLLDGKPATHQEINDAFANYPYELSEDKVRKNWARLGVCKEISYLTFDLYKSPPPAAILSGNVEWVDISEFDLAKLTETPYFLDGFRQTSAAGSNLMPAKKDILRVALFKGRLARYYDPKCEKIWWVETRPENEVFERPDLALVR
ncbi:M56 family metallopeptidase [Dyadobacter sp. CY343]|uniref:M56 family metallopeptidase n=1 Tax=Dyadobacter sp. CY343 TaxID=2907299 RepID=UPI001F30A9A6|nr:M56 family metallopeptidase [Dyadobacter sp. CY343]MCE7060602.1 M56 family metallopeptidase [Dyadobacter sp. CY343]